VTRLDIVIELHNERMRALDRAERAINAAAALSYSTFLYHAAENVKLAKVQENADFDAKKRLLSESAS